MYIFAEKTKAVQEAILARPASRGQGRCLSNPETSLFPQWQSSLAGQTAGPMPPSRAADPAPGLAVGASSSFGHDFSRLPIHPPAAGVVQAKLRVNQVGDEYEQQANRVSDRVMRMPGSLDQAPEPMRIKPVVSGDERQRTAPPGVTEVAATPGRPLDPATRGFMEPRFGHDFSRVRIHADPAAAGAARLISARAYTVNQHVVFGSGEYRPETAEGQRLLAHELTHVAQQNAGGTSSPAVVQREPDDESSLRRRPGKDGKGRQPFTELTEDDGPTIVPKGTLSGKNIVVGPSRDEDPAITALKAELVATYGFSGVTDTTRSRWTVPQLEKMKRALALVPAAERAAIKGVELRRVSITQEQGAVASGLFVSEAAAGKRQDRIEMADNAFESDRLYEKDKPELKFGGQAYQAAPSETTVLHEVGHAVESVDRRRAIGDEDTTQTTIKVSDGTAVKMTIRLAQFVALIESNQIEITADKLGSYAASNWPGHPGEAYAELYSFSLVAPQGMRNYDPKGELAKFFKSPVGVKDSQKTTVNAWLAKHR